MKTLLFTPLHITSIQDIYMAKCQARSFRLARLYVEHNDGYACVFTIDADNTEKFDSAFIYDCGCELLDLRVNNRKSNGIVEPTFAAIDRAVELGCDKMVRVTQDTQIIDITKFVKLNSEKSGQIYGGKDTCSDIKNYLSEIGVTMKTEKFDFVQGNFIMADTAIWAKYYKKLPKSVRHYCDDSIFSYLAQDDGVKLEFEVDKFWVHNRTRDIYYLESLGRM